MTRKDEGFALVEAIILGLALIVPVIWTVTVLSDLQRAAFGVTAAVREAGTQIGLAEDHSVAGLVAQRAVRLALEDHGLEAGRADFAWSSDLRRGSAVEVVAGYPVRVFTFPFIGSVAGGPAIWVRASHVSRIDPFGSRDG